MLGLSSRILKICISSSYNVSIDACFHWEVANSIVTCNCRMLLRLFWYMHYVRKLHQNKSRDVDHNHIKMTSQKKNQHV